MRSVLDSMRVGLTDLYETVRRQGDDFELPEPDDETIARTRSILRRDVPEPPSSVHHLSVDLRP